jgi:hypothetical protein
MISINRLSFIFLLITHLNPLFNYSQTGIQDASKGVKVSLSSTHLIGNGFNNAEIKTKGTVFYHKKWIETTFRQEKIKIKYDAFKGEMLLITGYKILPVDGILLLLENEEKWMAIQNKWFRLLNQKEGITILHHPYVIYKNRKTAQSGYEEDSPAEFRLKNSFFQLIGNRILPINRKEIRKRGLLNKI